MHEVYVMGIGTYIPPIVVPNAFFIDVAKGDMTVGEVVERHIPRKAPDYAEHSDVVLRGLYLECENLDVRGKRKEELTDEDIVQRMGIRTRRWAMPGEHVEHMAAQSLVDAIKSSGMDPKEITRIRVATASSDRIFPNAASAVYNLISQEYELAPNVGTQDSGAACAGFGSALEDACNYVRVTGEVVAVIASEELSKRVDFGQYNGFGDMNSNLFGDGAFAYIIGPRPGKVDIRIVGNVYQKTIPDTGDVITHDDLGMLRMPNGKSVYQYAVFEMAMAALSVADSNGLVEGLKPSVYSLKRHTMLKRFLKDTNPDFSRLDFVNPHQANCHIIDDLAETLGIRVLKNIEDTGNVSAVTTGLCFEKYIEDIKKVAQEKGVANVVTPTLGSGVGVTCWLTQVR